MDRKQLSGEDVHTLNQHILSGDERLSDLAKRKLTEYVNRPECFTDSNAQEWARRIVKRINRPS